MDLVVIKSLFEGSILNVRADKADGSPYKLGGAGFKCRFTEISEDLCRDAFFATQISHACLYPSISI
jgi:hypothetical protein